MNSERQMPDFLICGSCFKTSDVSIQPEVVVETRNIKDGRGGGQ